MFSLRQHFDQNRPYYILKYPLNPTTEENLVEKF